MDNKLSKSTLGLIKGFERNQRPLSNVKGSLRPITSDVILCKVKNLFLLEQPAILEFIYDL